MEGIKAEEPPEAVSDLKTSEEENSPLTISVNEGSNSLISSNPLLSEVSSSKSEEAIDKKVENTSLTFESHQKNPMNPTSPDNNEQGSNTSNVHYEGQVAIYTDPTNGYQYEWSSEKNEWLPRSVQYGFENDTHIYTDRDGVKFFWDKEKSAWFPKIDDDFMAQYQMSYGFIDNTSENKDAQDVVDRANKRKVELTEEIKGVDQNKTIGVKKKPSEPTWFEIDETQNTKVYVSNLPTDITEEEFIELMSKCGLVMRDLTNGSFKIKLYKEAGTEFLKGDALCTYIKIESVDLALQLLDGYNFKGKKIKVEKAKFEMKGQYDPKLKPKMKKRKDKQKLKKMQEKLFDWRPEKAFGERSKHERTVIVRNLFDPSIFDTDVSLILEFQQDLREECGKIGEVKKVIIYDRHPEGIAQINMSNPEEADEVVKLLNGRYFSKRQITAEIWDGKTKFKIAETDSQISQRLEKWDKFLEQEDGDKSNTQQVDQS
ncbi:HIV Tat-specific factor 1 homolog [Coccinella septempunctata]|uniref:HIV Tat-specific factor 1 homolog n=1 Tax=Coccinella septempunctata TaxID=41139 RepID=UPI001D099DCC|nr:HIV Tat-specific factor 1 homolog [Coccinella septempunctata]